MVSSLAHNPKVSRTPTFASPNCLLTLPLDWRASGEHSSAIPRISLPVRRPAMPFFLHQVSYTPEALARLIANPQDRFDAVRAPVDKLGGRVLNSYFAFGQYDAVLITEMPDNVSAAAIALAFAAGGSLRDCQTTALLSNAEGIEAMRKAATCGYRPVQAAASAAAATP